MFKINEDKKEVVLDRLFKEERKEKVREIVVEIDGMLFDGDEISQNRMARAYVVLEDDNAVIPWTLADNTTVEVSKGVLKRALLAAGEAQTKLWVR